MANGTEKRIDVFHAIALSHFQLSYDEGRWVVLAPKLIVADIDRHMVKPSSLGKACSLNLPV